MSTVGSNSSSNSSSVVGAAESTIKATHAATAGSSSSAQAAGTVADSHGSAKTTITAHAAGFNPCLLNMKLNTGRAYNSDSPLEGQKSVSEKASNPGESEINLLSDDEDGVAGVPS